MSHFCRPKKRTSFRRGKKCEGNTFAYLNYPDPAMKWKLVKSFVKAMLQNNNAVLEKKA
jgi:AICAR transformylase/IMP cyclohydrolase PurH